MEPFNFNELPEVVRMLFEKVEHIEKMLTTLQLPEEDGNELMNIQEAAAFLKVSVGSLYTRVSRKEIPVSKPGKKLYFNKTELREWIKEGKRKTLAETSREADGYRQRQWINRR